MSNKVWLVALSVLVAIALLMGGIGLYVVGQSHGTTNPMTTVWNNRTVERNVTVYINTTMFRNSTEYVNTTESVPVVNVSCIAVNGQNWTGSVVPVNYSFPVGTVTWVQFSFNLTQVQCSNCYFVSVNAPWTLLENSHVVTNDTVKETLLIGVPYWPGTYPLYVMVGAW